MGYTHYFTQKQSVDPLMWQNFREHLDKLYHHSIWPIPYPQSRFAADTQINLLCCVMAWRKNG